MDISGRKGIGNEFEQIDEDIQAEMVLGWQGIVTKHLTALTVDATESEIAQEILQEVLTILYLHQTKLLMIPYYRTSL